MCACTCLVCAAPTREARLRGHPSSHGYTHGHLRPFSTTPSLLSHCLILCSHSRAHAAESILAVTGARMHPRGRHVRQTLTAPSPPVSTLSVLSSVNSRGHRRDTLYFSFGAAVDICRCHCSCVCRSFSLSLLHSLLTTFFTLSCKDRQSSSGGVASP